METPVLGIQLNGYTLIRLIARGGMGEVYEATETKLQRRVALKLIAPPNPLEHDQDELVRRFLKEARTLAQINHPNVATIFSIDSIGGVPFLAMEYIDGVSFRELLEEFTFAADGALPLFQQMLDGLKALHEVRIIHRDLKPHNILLRPDGQVKILDFGIAKDQAGGTDLTRAGIVVGTLPYMPPELKVGVPASVRSDIWSLGAIFYECLTGIRLVVALKENVGHHDVPFNLEQQRRIPKDVRAFLGRMCASRPQDRFASVEEALLELQRLQNSRPAASSRIMSNLSRKIAELAREHRAEPASLQASARLLELVELSRGRETPKVALSAVTPDPVIRASTVRNSEAITLKPPAASLAPPVSLGTPRVKPVAPNPEVRKKTVPLGLGVVIAFVLLIAAFAKPILYTLKPVVVVSAPVVKEPVTVEAARPVEVALSLREPNDNQLLWLEPTSIATFSWTRFLTPNQYEIQIARDANFQRMIVRESVSGNKFRPAQILSEGNYFWRLWPHDTTAIVSPTFRFSVGLLSAVELNEPDAEHVFSQNKGDITLSWSTKPSIKQYRLQVSHTPEFNSPFYDTVVAANQTTMPVPPPGEHYWRVRPEDMPQATKYWSTGRQFLVKAALSVAPLKRAAQTLPEPRLNKQKQNVTLNFRHPPRDIASIAKSLAKAPELKWDPVPGARQYLVQLSTSKDFTHPIYEERVKTARVAWRTPVPGRAYWRVATFGASGERGAFSARGEVDVHVPTPTLKKAYIFQLKGGADVPSLRWPASPLADRYLVQIGRERKLASAQETTVAEPKLKLDMGRGEYFARVAAADPSGQAISAYSAPAKIDINEEPTLLPGPKLLQPSNNAHATSVSGRISIVFSWSEIAGAQTYALEVASDPDFQRILERRTETARGSLFRQSDFKGRVFWRVRAKSNQGYTEWSKPFHFDLK